MEFAVWIKGFYVLTAIFGCGVTAIDMLGILGDSDDGDVGDVGDGATGSDAEAIDDGGAAGDAAEAGGEADDGAATNHGPHHVSLLVQMRNLRRAVYFSLGFGPVGLVALGSGAEVITSLLWSVPSGLISMMLARVFFRFQQRDVDSSVSSRDLFFQRAEVLVPIAAGGMGRVRVFVGQSVVDRFARAEQPQEDFEKGDSVYITRVSDSCVFVERPTSSKQLEDES